MTLRGQGTRCLPRVAHPFFPTLVECVHVDDIHTIDMILELVFRIALYTLFGQGALWTSMSGSRLAVPWMGVKKWGYFGVWSY